MLRDVYVVCYGSVRGYLVVGSSRWYKIDIHMEEGLQVCPGPSGGVQRGRVVFLHRTCVVLGEGMVQSRSHGGLGVWGLSGDLVSPGGVGPSVTVHRPLCVAGTCVRRHVSRLPCTPLPPSWSCLSLLVGRPVPRIR